MLAEILGILMNLAYQRAMLNDNSVWMRSLTGFGDSPAQLRAQCIHLFGIFSRLWGVDSGLAMEQARAPMSKQSNKLTLAIYGIIYAWLSLYHLCVIHSFFSGYGFQSVPCGFYVHTVDGSEIPSNNHLGCFWKLIMNGINGSQPQLVKLSMSGSEPSKEPRSWSYAWWILGTLCEGPTFQRFMFCWVCFK